MPKYKVTRVMMYTETLEVVAEDMYKAIRKSDVLDGEHNNDDYLHDVRVQMIEE